MACTYRESMSYLNRISLSLFKYNKIYFETSKLIVKLQNTNDLKWQYKIINYKKFAAVLKGSYDVISSFAFSLECYKLFVHR